MTSDMLVSKLTGYFNGGRYSPERASELRRFCDGVAENSRDALFDSVTEERSANTPVTKADLKQACSRAGISYHPIEYIADHKVDCDCCGETFKYGPAPSDEQELQWGIHARCPGCGFQYAWTLQMKEYFDLGKATGWYDEYLVRFRSGGYGNGEVHGRWFQKDKELKAIEEDKRQTIQDKVESMRKYLADQKKQVQGGMA